MTINPAIRGSQLSNCKTPCINSSGLHKPDKILVLILFYTALTLTANITKAQPASKIDAALYQAVMGDAVLIMGGIRNIAVKREHGVRYGLFSTKNHYRDHVDQLLAEIAVITSLTIERARKPVEQPTVNSTAVIRDFFNGDSNLTIVISSRETMLEIAKGISLRPVYHSALNSSKASCFFAPSVNNKAQIVNGLIFISDDLSGPMINTCLNEEIYQSFGLFNDANNSEYFSFNNKVQPKSITIYDQTLLQTLYSAAVKPGTSVTSLLQLFTNNLDGLFQVQTTLLDE